MSRRTERAALRTARAGRGWSQAEAARRLHALAHSRDGPEASAASLKTQLSRWENGHAVPEPEYRNLLGELYGRSVDELGLLPTPERLGPTGSARLHAQLAAAAAVDDGVIALWADQVAGAGRLDDELGAAGSAELVRAMVEQLGRTLAHTVSPSMRSAVARLLAEVAALAGRQALDQGDPESAWLQHGTALSAARECAWPAAEAEAVTGRAEVLREIEANDAAVELLTHAGARSGPPATCARLAAARAVAHAAAGDAPAAHRALAELACALPAPLTPGAGASDAPPGTRPGGARSLPDLVRHADGPVVELADLHQWRGQTLATLRDPAAVGPLKDALAAGPRSVRHRAALHADLALALGSAGRGEEAAEHARTARRLAERIGSRRIAARLSRSTPA